MTDDDECIHLLDPRTCTICNGRDAREHAEARRVVTTTTAQFASTLRCGHEVELGDLISLTGDGRWLCEDCAP